jgi:glucose-6-phosphate 1-dehydrogenase
LFGATGDLARRKLLPGLYRLAASGLLPDRYQIIGSAPQHLTDEQFGDLALQAITEFGTSKPAGGAWQAFRQGLSFASAEAAGDTSALTAAIEKAERQIGRTPRRLFHLAVPPTAFEPPTSFDAKHLRDEAAKVFDALKPLDVRHVVRGQYAGYTGESGVAQGSRTRNHGRGPRRGRQLAVVRCPILPAVR